MTTATVTTCVDCPTTVRPNKLRCDRCRHKTLDKMLDERRPRLALTIASRNTREG